MTVAAGGKIIRVVDVGLVARHILVFSGLDQNSGEECQALIAPENLEYTLQLVKREPQQQKRPPIGFV